MLAELGVPGDKAQEQQDAEEKRDGDRLSGARCRDFPRTAVVVLPIAHVSSRLRYAIMANRVHRQQQPHRRRSGIQSTSRTCAPRSGARWPAGPTAKRRGHPRRTRPACPTVPGDAADLSARRVSIRPTPISHRGDRSLIWLYPRDRVGKRQYPQAASFDKPFLNLNKRGLPAR